MKIKKLTLGGVLKWDMRPNYLGNNDMNKCMDHVIPTCYV